MDNPVRLSVVVPVFNSAVTLPELCGRIVASLQNYAGDHEIICVDDGSSDASWAVITSLAATYSNIGALRLKENMGQAAATLIGLKHARGEWVATLDDDLQHMPEHLPQLLAARAEGIELVYAAALNPQKGKPYVMLAHVIRMMLALLCRANFLRHMQTYRLMRRDIYPWERIPATRTSAIEGILARARPRTVKLYVEYKPRAIGTSTYTLRRLLALIVNTVRLAYSLPKGPEAEITSAAGWLKQD